MGSFVFRGIKLIVGYEGCETHDKKRERYMNLQEFCCRIVSMNCSPIHEAVDGEHSCIYRNRSPVTDVEQSLQWMQPAGRCWPLLLCTPIVDNMTCMWTMYLKALLC